MSDGAQNITQTITNINMKKFSFSPWFIRIWGYENNKRHSTLAFLNYAIAWLTGPEPKMPEWSLLYNGQKKLFRVSSMLSFFRNCHHTPFVICFLRNPSPDNLKINLYKSNFSSTWKKTVIIWLFVYLFSMQVWVHSMWHGVHVVWCACGDWRISAKLNSLLTTRLWT